MDERLRRALRRFAEREISAVPSLGDWDAATLSTEALGAARHVWHRRYVNESGSVVVASRMLAVANALSPDEELSEALARLVADEERHVALAKAFCAHLGAEPAAEPPLPSAPEGDDAHQFGALLLSGLCLGEAISAARYACVRDHTDLEVPRRCIELLLRDEVAHAELGFVLAPQALADLLLEREWIVNELRSSFTFLDVAVGLDAERRGLDLALRPQPSNNPGVVEPLVDAAAFYLCIAETVVPRLDAAGIPATEAWTSRW